MRIIIIIIMQMFEGEGTQITDWTQPQLVVVIQGHANVCDPKQSKVLMELGSGDCHGAEGIDDNVLMSYKILAASENVVIDYLMNLILLF